MYSNFCLQPHGLLQQKKICNPGRDKMHACSKSGLHPASPVASSRQEWLAGHDHGTNPPHNWPGMSFIGHSTSNLGLSVRLYSHVLELGKPPAPKTPKFGSETQIGHRVYSITTFRNRETLRVLRERQHWRRQLLVSAPPKLSFFHWK